MLNGVLETWEPAAAQVDGLEGKHLGCGDGMFTPCKSVGFCPQFKQQVVIQLTVTCHSEITVEGLNLAPDITPPDTIHQFKLLKQIFT